MRKPHLRELSALIDIAIKRGNGILIETNLTRFKAFVERVRRFDYSSLAGFQDVATEIRRTLAAERSASSETDDTLAALFALACEAYRRTLTVEIYDEQLIAGKALSEAKLAQLRTGEGKTFAALFAVCAEVYRGRRVHVFTANDYLAQRDAEWLKPVYAELGVSVGCITEDTDRAERRSAYEAEVTYLTAKQAGFDLLTDGIRGYAADRIQRSLETAIVDEADFILIDEARTPLVLARADRGSEIDLEAVDRFVRTLRTGIDYYCDKARRNALLTVEGEHKAEDHFGLGSHEERAFVLYESINVSLHAHKLLRRDVDYIVRGGRVELVDELTGRVADKRRWPHGIQSALEVKERLPVQREGRVAASITIGNFVSRYQRLAAMTATAIPAAAEFAKDYGLAIVIIPPHREDRLESLPDRVYRTKAAKLDALIREIATVHRTGRPVLIGTRSIAESAELARLLEETGLKAAVLNAKNDREEAQIIARAGEYGALTISTNMAGRGTDIKLGFEAARRRDEIAALGGLHVIGSTRNESRRIDDQLRGRAGRQGDPGTSQFFVSLEDDLIVKYGVTDLLPREYRASSGSGTSLRETDGLEPIQDRRVGKEIERAQQIIEEQHASMRRTLRRYHALVDLQYREYQELRESMLADPDESFAVAAIDCLDAFWMDHLAYVEERREGIHLHRLAKEDPLLVFIHDVSEEFDAGIERALGEAHQRYRSGEHGMGARPNPGNGRKSPAPAADGSPEADGRLRTGVMESQEPDPGETWTYLVNDDPFPVFKLGTISELPILRRFRKPIP